MTTREQGFFELCLIYTLFYYFSLPKTCILAIQKQKIASLSPGDRKADEIETALKPGSQNVRKSAGNSRQEKSGKAILSNPAKKKPEKAKSAKPVSVIVNNEKKGKSVPAKKKSKGFHKLILQLQFHTVYGQELFVVGDHPLMGNNQQGQALPMQYVSDANWVISIDWTESKPADKDISYHYILRNTDGTFQYDWGTDKTFRPSAITSEELLVVDAWNYAGYFENTFYTEPFADVLLRENKSFFKIQQPRKGTHTLKVKSPLLTKDQTLCLLGSDKVLGEWDIRNPLLLGRNLVEDVFTISLDLSDVSFPIAYKYGVYDVSKQAFLRFEDGNNRLLQAPGKPNRTVLVNDGFAVLPNNTWKGTGLAIPVFSLRSENSFGIGEFTDMKLLVDWAKKVGLKMIQLLPINDTTATHTWVDSYPYAAISAFALHPMYLNLAKMADARGKQQLQKLETERLRLNGLAKVDYEAVNKIKWDFIRLVYARSGATVLASTGFRQYFERNRHWLVPYAAFCYLRDQYATVDFGKWPAYRTYDRAVISELTDPGSDGFSDIGLHYFIQYHLHCQLREATDYAHAKGIIVKGDIAIGVYRHGVDAWQNPSLYHLDFQAGAPPDDFAIKGQNWGFPTYNWQRMKENGFAWWKQRFAQMSDYFDAFRIDHILGFFRIWSIPMHAVEGIMGHFVPAIPVHINEFNSRGIWFDHKRYTTPYISENVLWKVFGYDNDLVRSLFLSRDSSGLYMLKPAFATQRLVEAHFETLEKDEHHAKIKQGLFDLISNVILFEEAGSEGQEFHFRFGMESTLSFQELGEETRNQLKDLYVNYFFRRQDEFWKKEALQKLPALKRETNMLVCGEDLGLVPECVPDVMRQLGLLSLEIQRMPKDPAKKFFHPNDAPYLSVVTPSTHDMSTIRGWWEEDREKTRQFYHEVLGQQGEAPYYCEAWINKAIVIQHLYSSAMWSVFQLQDLLGMNELLRRDDPNEERINVPSNPKNYWQYRMHLFLEELLAAEDFTDELKEYITASGR